MTPEKPYTDVKSDHIKQEIAQRDFDNRDDRKYVNQLVLIESLIEKDGIGRCGGRTLENLKKRYPAAYNRIQKELQPEKHQERKKQEKKRKIRNKFKEIRKRYEKRGKKRLEAQKQAKARSQWNEVKEQA